MEGVAPFLLFTRPSRAATGFDEFCRGRHIGLPLRYPGMKSFKYGIASPAIGGVAMTSGGSLFYWQAGMFV